MLGKYEHERKPFTKAIASELIFKNYKGRSPVNQDTIQEQIYQYHKDRGGLPPEVRTHNQNGESYSENDIKQRISDDIRRHVGSALRGLKSNGCATEKERKVWCIHEIDIHRDEQTYPKELGIGEQEVYLYYYRTYRENAVRKKMNYIWKIYYSEILWQCKIGETHEQDTETRVNQQKGMMPEKPIIALIMKTDNSKSLEKMIQDILKFGNKHIKDAQGDEWFMTTPDEVEDIYNFLQSISRIRI